MLVQHFNDRLSASASARARFLSNFCQPVDPGPEDAHDDTMHAVVRSAYRPVSLHPNLLDSGGELVQLLEKGVDLATLNRVIPTADIAKMFQTKFRAQEENSCRHLVI
jgi:hypothetical protein